MKCIPEASVSLNYYKKENEDNKIIRIYHECEGRTIKSDQRIAVWHHEACRVMANGDPEGRIFFLLTTLFIYLFYNKLPEVPEYTKMQFHMMTLLDVLGKIAWVR